MRSVTMPVSIEFNFRKKDDNFFGTAKVHTPSNKTYVFRTMMPMQDIREEVQHFLRAQPAIAGSPDVVTNIGYVHNHVAVTRAKRRLGTAIKAKFGGNIRPFEVAGPARFARRIAVTAKRKAMVRGNPGADVGFNPFKAVAKGVKKVAKGVGKGAKAVGKGTVKVAKTVAKPVAKGGKLAFKGTKKVVTSPLGLAAATFLPGGAQAIAVANALKKGNTSATNVKFDDGLSLRQTPLTGTPAGQPGTTDKGGGGSSLPLVLAGGAALLLLLGRK